MHTGMLCTVEDTALDELYMSDSDLDQTDLGLSLNDSDEPDLWSDNDCILDDAECHGDRVVLGNVSVFKKPAHDFKDVFFKLTRNGCDMFAFADGSIARFSCGVPQIEANVAGLMAQCAGMASVLDAHAGTG